ncbi:hypothetical protein CDAR_275761, partial [Caerostris darwini]
ATVINKKNRYQNFTVCEHLKFGQYEDFNSFLVRGRALCPHSLQLKTRRRIASIPQDRKVSSSQTQLEL